MKAFRENSNISFQNVTYVFDRFNRSSFFNGRKDYISFCWSVADPGFPEEGAPTLQEGAPTYDFAKLSQKLHKIERIWTPGGGGARPKLYYVDPPLLMFNILLNIFNDLYRLHLENDPQYAKTLSKVILVVPSNVSFTLMLTSPLTYTVYPLSVHCKCAMKQN